MVATPSTYPKPLTGNTAIDSVTSGYYWVLDSTRTIKWSLSNGFSYGESWSNPIGMASEIERGLKLISYYANIKFSYVGQYANPIVAAAYSQITFSLDSFSNSNLLGLGCFPATSWDNYFGYSGSAGDVYINLNSAANYLTYEPGAAGFALLVHEIGHALGLKHTHDSGPTGNRPTFSSLGQSELDKDWVSIMSYGDDYDWNYLQWEPITPMALDALGLMAMYGPNMKTNAGNSTVYVSFSDGYATRWDASGNDTLDFSKNYEGCAVVLNGATNEYLNIDMGFAVPLYQLLYDSPTEFLWLLGTHENVVGTYYGDYIKGNISANRISGNSGSDVLYGLSGNDQISGGDGDDTLTGGAGSDRLTGGSGADLFVVDYDDFDFHSSPKVLADTITDLKTYEGDLVDLSSFGFDVGFAASKSAGQSAGEVLFYDTSSGKVYFDLYEIGYHVVILTISGKPFMTEYSSVFL